MPGLGPFFGAGPNLPVWFDPKLFAGTASYAGAVWIAGVPLAIAAGMLTEAWVRGAASYLSGMIGIVVWTAVVIRATPRVQARFRERRQRAVLACPSCGESTMSATCPTCGASVTAPVDGPPAAV